MPNINVDLHIIWSTKNRDKIITKELKPILLEHIKSNSIQKEIFIDSINYAQNHIHILNSLSSDQNISKVVQLLKSESSYWVNKNKLTNGKFELQYDYIAVSLSKSMLDKVRKYIAKQEEHHRTKSFTKEIAELNEKFCFDVPI